MENCPYCDAPGSYREATDGSCYVCGMMLPNLSGKNEPGVATAVAEPADEAAEPSGTPGRDEPTIVEEPVVEPSAAPTIFMQNTEPPAIDLIQAQLEVNTKQLGTVVSQLMRLNGPTLQVSAYCFPYGIPVPEWFRLEVNIRNAGR